MRLLLLFLISGCSQSNAPLNFHGEKIGENLYRVCTSKECAVCKSSAAPFDALETCAKALN
jgi:hypothetical protein